MRKDEIIDVEPIQTQVVACAKCGQKNRISNESMVQFRCGACKHILNPETPIFRSRSIVSNLRIGRHVTSKALRGLLLTIIGAATLTVLFMAFSESPNKTHQPLPEATRAQTTPSPQSPTYTRMATDPNGHPWPTYADYLRGSKKSHTRGHSTVTVDNKENDSDVYVKLIALGDSREECACEFYIPARSKFTVPRVSPGPYEVRFLMLDSGGLSKTDLFHLERTRTSDGTTYTTITLTLYRVPYGNMHIYSISRDEFYNVPTGEDEAPNLSLNSDSAYIAFRPLSTSRFLGSTHRLGAGWAG